MLEKIGIILGLVLSALALASAFENFSNVGLLWKLVVTAVAGLIMSQVVANWLAKWTNPSEQFPGFGRPPAGRSTGRFCFSLVLLGALCGAFVGLSLLLIQWFTLQLHETKTVEKSITLLIAPYSRVEGITIQLPSKNDSKCAWTDKEPKSFPRLNIQMIDWDSMTPKLHIDQFSYPQRIMVDCSPARTIRDITISPSSTPIYLAEQLQRWHYWSFVLGGLTWLIACVELWYWSR